MTARRTRVAALFIAAVVLAACATEPPAAATRSAPADGDTMPAPLLLVRVWFNEATDLEHSALTLEGPDGDVPLVGVHSMGEGDLMASVDGSTPPGDYELTWTAAGAGGTMETGVVHFTVSPMSPD